MQLIHAIQDKRETNHAGKTLSKVFGSSQVSKYLFPEEKKRPSILSSYFSKLANYGRLYGKVLTSTNPDQNNRMEGVAIWIRSKDIGQSMLRSLRAGIPLATLRMSPDSIKKTKSYNSYIERIRREECPPNAYYLAVLGVHPDRRKQGIGRSLIEPVLKDADQEQVACFLETQDQPNLKYYEAYGFEVVFEGKPSDDAPHTWFLLRPPAARSKAAASGTGV